MERIPLVLAQFSVHQSTFIDRVLVFVPHVPRKIPLPRLSRCTSADRATKPLVDLLLSLGCVERATRCVSTQSRWASEADHVLMFRAADVTDAVRQVVKIDARSDVDLTHVWTVTTGSAHFPCAIRGQRDRTMIAPGRARRGVRSFRRKIRQIVVGTDSNWRERPRCAPLHSGTWDSASGSSIDSATVKFMNFPTEIRRARRNSTIPNASHVARLPSPACPSMA